MPPRKPAEAMPSREGGKFNVSPTYARPARNPFLSPTYAKTEGTLLPKMSARRHFRFFPLIFCSYSYSTHCNWQAGWPCKFVRGAKSTLKRPALQAGMRREERPANLPASGQAVSGLNQRSRADSHDLARLNGIEVRQAGGDVDQQVFQAVGVRTKNENCDGSADKILLVFDALIHGEENIEFGDLRGGKKIAVLKSGESSITSGLALMTGEGVAETLIDAFVNENAHLGTREQQVFRFFEGGEGRFARDGGEALQK